MKMMDNKMTQIEMIDELHGYGYPIFLCKKALEITDYNFQDALEALKISDTIVLGYEVVKLKKRVEKLEKMRKENNMLKEFLNERKERIQNLMNKGFEVEIAFKDDNSSLGSRVRICIKHSDPWFCECGSYYLKDNDDHSFTKVIEKAEKLDIDKTIVEEFIKSLSK